MHYTLDQRTYTLVWTLLHSCLASQINQIKDSHQWDNRCHSQIVVAGGSIWMLALYFCSSQMCVKCATMLEDRTHFDGNIELCFNVWFKSIPFAGLALLILGNKFKWQWHLNNLWLNQCSYVPFQLAGEVWKQPRSIQDINSSMWKVCGGQTDGVSHWWHQNEFLC